MPRSIGTQTENSFVKGLITEATALNFPENACTDTYDCIFDDTGKVTRRLGIDYENGYTQESVERNNSAITEYVWHSVAGQNRTFVVQQFGDTLHYFSISPLGVLSDNYRPFTTSLTTFETGTAAQTRANVCQYATGNGKLFVSHPFCTPFYVEYDDVTDTITETVISVVIRDMEGVEDGLLIDERPTVETDEHHYNVYNQGWGEVLFTDAGGDEVAYVYWDNGRADFPSNADIWWVYKDGTNEQMDLNNVNTFAMGNSPAPKGHIFLDAFNQDRANAEGAPAGLTLPVVSSGDNQPSCVAFFAGRVFFAGVKSTKFNNKIYFSQIVEKDAQIPKCYQQLDPTAEHASDLLPSDGGVIVIPEIGYVIKMIPIKDSLIVFASNGVWAITGSDGIGFKATDYSVLKINGQGANLSHSFVDVDGMPMWWTVNGIYGLITNEQGELDVKSFSETTIQTYFDAIPTQGRLYAKGAYNPNSKIIQWIHRTEIANDIDNRYQYFNILNLNLNTGAFYPWRLPSVVPKINGIICLENNFATSTTPTTFFYTTTEPVSDTDYLMTYSREWQTDYHDWATPLGGTGEDYTSYGVTGYKVHGEGNKNFQTPYIDVYVESDDLASLFLQGKWDFQTFETMEQQVYRDRDGYHIQRRRIILRGQGRALQLKFFSEEGRPFSLIGWASWEARNDSP